MGSSSGSGVPANRQRMFRFAPYIESKHENLLTSVAGIRASIITNSPYESYTDQDVNTVMFGVGYLIADFSSLYDMFGKFMSGLDLESLWNTAFSTQIEVDEIDKVTTANLALLDENVLKIGITDFRLFARDTNAVTCSSFTIGIANIERDKITQLVNMSMEIKSRMLILTTTFYNSLLNWQKNAIDLYAEVMKSYYLFAMAIAETNTRFAFLNIIWPFTVLDFERATLAALTSKASFNKYTSKRKRSDLSKVLLVASYTVQGMTIGSYFPPYGTAIGGVIGFTIGVATVMSE